VTPKSFLSFLEGYKTLYSEKLANLGELAGRMTTGLLKLDEASESVDEQELVVANQKADKVRAWRVAPLLRPSSAATWRTEIFNSTVLLGHYSFGLSPYWTLKFYLT